MAAYIFSKRKVAYVLTLVCYREVNCWEHYHTQQKVLDMSIYEEMLSVVKEKLAFYLPFVKYMRMSSENHRTDQCVRCIYQASEKRNC